MNRYFLPIIILIIVLFSYKKCNVYESFIKGCKTGLNMSLELFPSILAIIFSTRIFISSGILKRIIYIISPALKLIKFPSELFFILVLKPISASSVMSFMIDLYKTYGVDSKISIMASIVYSVTDTSIYILSLYLGILNIKKTGYLYPLCIFINIIGIIICIITVNIFIY